MHKKVSATVEVLKSQSEHFYFSIKYIDDLYTFIMNVIDVRNFHVINTMQIAILSYSRNFNTSFLYKLLIVSLNCDKCYLHVSILALNCHIIDTCKRALVRRNQLHLIS